MPATSSIPGKDEFYIMYHRITFLTVSQWEGPRVLSGSVIDKLEINPEGFNEE